MSETNGQRQKEARETERQVDTDRGETQMEERVQETDTHTRNQETKRERDRESERALHTPALALAHFISWRLWLLIIKTCQGA